MVVQSSSALQVLRNGEFARGQKRGQVGELGHDEAVGPLPVPKWRTEARAACLTFSLQTFKLSSGVVACVFFGLRTNA